MTDASSLQIVSRMLLREVEPARLWRVVLVQPPHLAWLAPVLADDWPHARELSVMREQIETGHLTCEQVDPHMRKMLPEILADDRKSERDARRWSAIASLVTEGTNLVTLLTGRGRGALLVEHAKQHGTSYQNLVLLLRRYWARGMSPAAVSSDYEACGAKGRPRTLTQRKPGRVRTTTDEAGQLVCVPCVVRTEEVCKRFQHGAVLHLSKKWTLKQSWREILKLWWSDIRVDERGEPVGGLDAAYPTLRQFENFVRTRFPEVERRKRQLGPRTWDLTGRALPGRADDDTDGPGSRFEIDATIADIYLVSQYDRARIVGRPTVYFVVDVWTRLITGLYIGFEAPSWLGAISALVNAATPKVEFCRALGREIEAWEWPSQHLPAKLLGDRGEMISLRSGRNLVSKLHVQIENTPPYRGDLKSIVERRFGSIPAVYKNFVPGYVRPDFGKRGAEDYRKSAKLTLPEFTTIVMEAVLEHNRTPPEGQLPPPGMVADDLTGSPVHRWAWGIANRSGRLAEWDLDVVALNLLPVGQARLTARGVEFAGGVYWCPDLEGTDWRERARLATVEVNVSYDPRCMNHVYLMDQRLANKFVRLARKGLGVERTASLAEIEENAGHAKKAIVAAERKSVEQSIMTDMRIKRITEAATTATDIARGGKRPGPKDLAGIRDNKATEKALNRPSELLLPSPATPTGPKGIGAVSSPEREATIPATDLMETPRERLLRLRREREEKDA